MRFEVLPAHNPAVRERWNAFASSVDGSSVLQSYEWGEVKRGLWQPFYTAVTDETGQIILAALILKRPMPLVGRAIFYAPRGPLFRELNAALLKAFADGVCALAKKENVFALRCDPEIEETNTSILSVFQNAGFSRNPENIQPRGTILLDIRPGEDDLLKSFHHKTRYNIKLAEKKGVTVEEINSSDGIDIFYDLFEITSARDKFMILRRSYFQHLHKTLSNSGLSTVFVAKYDGKPLGAVILTTFGKRMVYLYGASSNAHRNLMPNHLLHWRAILWAKERGLTTYDFWGVPANPTETSPLWGVYRFKKGFNETETRWVGTYELVFNRFWYFVFEKAAVAFKTAIRFLKTGKIKSSVGD
ncbi:MAG TPA: peptidoglycan bridge formation glycyltransferase FemA/FemB family protein [bacterium]|nr:peptidoglycan bridge formation glycyltransferase FemA/FemB family protein [bacterium]